MKVKIIDCNTKSFWYSSCTGQTFDVVQAPSPYTDHWTLSDGTGWQILKEDCEILAEITLDRVNFVLEEQSVEALETCVERMQAHIEERKKPKPFTQKEFDEVVAELRSCRGRRAFEHNKVNHTLKVSNGTVSWDEWTQTRGGLFGIYFATRANVIDAALTVGHVRIMEALKFYENIGL